MAPFFIFIIHLPYPDFGNSMMLTILSWVLEADSEIFMRLLLEILNSVIPYRMKVGPRAASSRPVL